MSPSNEGLEVRTLSSVDLEERSFYEFYICKKINSTNNLMKGDPFRGKTVY